MKLRLLSSVVAVAALCILIPSSALGIRGPKVDVTKLHDVVRLSLGQKAVIAFDKHGDKLTNPHRVKAESKDSTVSFDFFVDPKNKELMVLVVRGSHRRTVRYRAATREKGSAEFYESNMSPIYPNVPVLEGWDLPYVELVLFDFHLTDEVPKES